MASTVSVPVVLFKSVFTDKYLRPIVESMPLNGRLSADGKGDPKLYLERASSGDGTRYHIKSHETKKYWQVKSASDGWITADADAINENQNNSECTLFDIVQLVTPSTTGTTTTVRLRHQYLGRYACLDKASDDYPYCLRALADNLDSKDVFVSEKIQ